VRPFSHALDLPRLDNSPPQGSPLFPASSITSSSCASLVVGAGLLPPDLPGVLLGHDRPRSSP